MFEYVVECVQSALNDRGKAVKGTKILVSGLAYKKNITDVRESPAFDVIAGLKKRGADVSYMDPWAPEVDEHGLKMTGVDPKGSFAPYDVVVIVTDFAERYAPARRQMGEWIKSGKLKYREDIVEGIDKAPRAFIGMLRGENFGKMLVKLA